jgi:hypothetical protein
VAAAKGEKKKKTKRGKRQVAVAVNQDTVNQTAELSEKLNLDVTHPNLNQTKTGAS